MRYSRKQERFLSQSIQLEELGNPALVNCTMIVVCLLLIGFISWSGFTTINEVARTPGEVIPEGNRAYLQHLEGGVVTQIAVQDGDEVKKGDVLMIIDGAGAKEDLARARSKQNTLLLQEERLRAAAEGRNPDFLKFQNISEATQEDYLRHYGDMEEAHKADRRIISDQIAQKNKSISVLEEEIGMMQRNEAIAQDLYNRREKLNRDGYTSDIKFLESKRNLNDVQAQIQSARGRIGIIHSEIAELNSRMMSLDKGRREGVNERLDQIVAEKSENTELIAKLQDRVSRLALKSPEDGVVKGLSDIKIGSVIKPGQTIMEIVPLNRRMVVQARIQPQYIGHIHKGQKVEIKFSSFDYSRYGVVPGVLRDISAMTFTGEGGERYYEAYIDLERPYVGHDTRNRVLPGMTVMANIITGEKSVLAYLLKPVHNAMKSTFTER